MRFFLALAVSCVALVGCGDSSKLSRSKAEDMIQNTVRFNTLTSRIPTGSYSQNLDWNGESRMGSGMEKILSELSRRELIAFQKNTSGGWTSYAISISTKGKQFFLKEFKPDIARHMGRPDMVAVIKLCERKIVELTGIEQPTPQTAKVSFNYKTLNPTPFGETTPKDCSSEVRKGAAEMKLFDDGWRVGSVIFYTDHGYDLERDLD